VALPAGQDVTWLNPLLPGADCTATDYATPLSFMYRPVVWISDSLTVDYQNSIASSITVSDHGQKYVVKMRPYRWSNGQSVTARDVATYFYLLSQGAKTADCIYGLGGMPTEVKSFKVLNSSTFEVDYTPRPGGYNPNWVELSGFPGLVPLPTEYWLSLCPNTGFDPSHSNPTSAGLFWKCLQAQGGNLHWPGWKVVSGPFHLDTSLTRPSSQYVFTPNAEFSGHKPSLHKVVLVSETSTQNIYTGLRSGQLDVGVVPASLASDVRGLTGYTSTPATRWSASYVGLTQDPKAPGDAVAAFRNEDVRIALQYGIDSATIIEKVSNGVWYSNNSLVPPKPSTYLDPALATPAYPFSIQKGDQLLSKAGYPMVDGKRRFKDGKPFTFTLTYPTGDVTKANIAQLLQSDWGKMGLTVKLNPLPPSQLSGLTFNSQQARTKLQAFMQMSGWDYFPDYYPTGEQMVTCGGVVASAFGSYCSPKLDGLVAQSTEYASTPAQAQQRLNQYQQYLAKNAVMLFGPLGWGLLTVAKSVHNIDGHFSNFSYLPEYWTRS
jgi:peptide/nickel transport system substrate-binding protein